MPFTLKNDKVWFVSLALTGRSAHSLQRYGRLRSLILSYSVSEVFSLLIHPLVSEWPCTRTLNLAVNFYVSLGLDVKLYLPPFWWRREVNRLSLTVNNTSKKCVIKQLKLT